jgi:hypothetical protein
VAEVRALDQEEDGHVGVFYHKGNPLTLEKRQQAEERKKKRRRI